MRANVSKLPRSNTETSNFGRAALCINDLIQKHVRVRMGLKPINCMYMRFWQCCLETAKQSSKSELFMFVEVNRKQKTVAQHVIR